MLWLMTALLLLLFASRGNWLSAIQLDVDEVWSVWQTLGTPADIIRWTPYDWTPTYYLMLGAWRGFTGIQPEFLRLFTLLCFMIGTSALYRCGKFLLNERMGLIAAAAFGGLGFVIFASVHVRGLAITLALLPLVFWLMLRYFNRPTLPRGILLGVMMAALFWIYLNSPMALAMLVVVSLCLYPRKWLRWWLPGGVLALLSMPLVLDKFTLAASRVEVTSQAVLPPLLEALASLYRNFFGDWYAVWTVIFGIASVLVVLWVISARARAKRDMPGANLNARFAPIQLALALFIWGCAAAPALYFLNPLLGFFSVRYGWWIAPGIVLWIALGAMMLPKLAQYLAAGVLALLMFAPVNPGWYGITDVPVAAMFEWLEDRLLPGDAVVIDPHCRCPAGEVFEYYRAVHFPDGLYVLDQPGDVRRIWYLSTDGEQTPELMAAVQAGRQPGEFVGPWDFLLRLYEAPPDSSGVGYENGMRFHGFEAYDPHGIRETSLIVRHEGDPITVRLWWGADSVPLHDYSVGLYLLAPDGTLIVQNDNTPQIAPASTQTSQWATGSVYTEMRELLIPMNTRTGAYQLVMAIYDAVSGERIIAPGFTDQADLLLLETIYITSW